MASLTRQSSEKFKIVRENFINASKNILKIKKDMEFLHKAVKKIAIYQSNFEKSKQTSTQNEVLLDNKEAIDTEKMELKDST